MLSPEKNDVDVKKLFNWNDEITIYAVDGIENETVYMRLVGDSDWGIARLKALRASAELRTRFADPNSDEHLAYIPVKEQLDKEALVKMLLILMIPTFRNEVIKNVSIAVPKEPSSDATLEEQENYQKELDAFEEKRTEIIKKEIEKLSNKREKELSKLSLDKLYDDYKKELISTMCSEEFNKIFINYCTYLGTYEDENFTTKYFDSFEQFSNLPTAVKNQFVNSYMNLDIGVYELKK